MLSKLFKYEIKATGRIFLPLFLSLLVFAGITRLLSALGPQQWYSPSMISMAIYVIIMVGMFVITIVVMIQRFYNNLLADEGYLMFTLPVKPWQHIMSKLFASMLWMAASVIVAIISIVILAFEHGAFAEILKELSYFFNSFYLQLGLSPYLLTFEVMINMLVTLASGILMIYASIAIGHLFGKHKMLASFGSFIVLNALSQVLFLLISLIPGIAYFKNIHITSDNLFAFQSVIQLAIAYQILSTGLLSLIYFAAANYILDKRLNLE